MVNLEGRKIEGGIFLLCAYKYKSMSLIMQIFSIISI